MRSTCSISLDAVRATFTGSNVFTTNLKTVMTQDAMMRRARRLLSGHLWHDGGTCQIRRRHPDRHAGFCDMAFQAIFRDLNTFGETCLVLFKALLGDVDFFDFFSGGEHDVEATILLVSYLVIISVMLLNLLIAVLSTSHARIQGTQELEHKTSKVRLIEHYRLTVDEHLLPPPFNLAQLVVSAPFALAHRSWGAAACVRARELVGLFTFWLVMGSIGLVGGVLLWWASVMHTPLAWERAWSWGNPTRRLRASRFAICAVWCLVGAPLYLFVFWFTTPLKWVNLQPWRWLWDLRERPKG